MSAFPTRRRRALGSGLSKQREAHSLSVATGATHTVPGRQAQSLEMTTTTMNPVTAPPAPPAPPNSDERPERPERPGGDSRQKRDRGSLAQRLSLLGLLIGTGFLYLWNLGVNGWANAFYSAAIQAGSVSWKAFLFGSSDAGNSITVDKPPASLWLPELSVRIFGLNSWSILVPEALMGVASVWILYLAVSRVSGRWVGLIAGAALALTPVAMLMFRFNNPEALLILLSVAAVYGVVRAVQASIDLASSGTAAKRGRGAMAWMIFVGVMIGLGFLTKQLQAFVLIPPLALAYLVAARGPWLRRLGHLLASAAAVVVSAGWWVAIVELWPASSRPYIGGSQNNSFLELTFGYNGLGRLNGEEDGSVGNHWGTPSLLRLVSGNYLTQISWLVPAALILIAATVVLIVRTKAWRSDGGRLRMGAFIALAGWFLVEGLTISLMQGITHEYYTAILAAPIAGAAAIGAGWLWEKRTSWVASVTLAVAVATAAITAVVILSNAGWGVAWAVICSVLAVLGAVGIALRPLWACADERAAAFQAVVAAEGSAHPTIAGAMNAAPSGALTPPVEAWGGTNAGSLATPSTHKKWRTAKVARTVGGVAIAASLLGSLGTQAAFAASTTTVAKTGSIIYAGPSDRMGGMGGGPGGMGGGRGQGGTGTGPGTGQGGTGGTGNGGFQGGPPSMQGGTSNGTGTSNGAGTSNGSTNGSSNGSTTTQGGGFGGSSDGRGGAGGAGGLLGTSAPSAEMTALLEADASSYRWAAATVGAQNAASYQLATEASVMPIGGFNGTDLSPTLDQFKEWVAAKDIHYYISSGSMGGGMGGNSSTDSTSAQIKSWVEANFTAQTVGSTTVYDLTQPNS